ILIGSVRTDSGKPGSASRQSHRYEGGVVAARSPATERESKISSRCDCDFLHISIAWIDRDLFSSLKRHAQAGAINIKEFPREGGFVAARHHGSDPTIGSRLPGTG